MNSGGGKFIQPGAWPVSKFRIIYHELCASEKAEFSIIVLGDFSAVNAADKLLIRRMAIERLQSYEMPALTEEQKKLVPVLDAWMELTPPERIDIIEGWAINLSFGVMP
jgi:hypothetical protein